MKLPTYLSLPILLAVSAPLFATQFNVSANSLNPASIPSIQDLQPRAGLLGTLVTFNFAGGPPALTAVFNANGLAQTSDPNVFLQMDAAGIPDTNLGIWTLTNATPMMLQSVSIVGYGPGSAYGMVFDRTLPAPGTLNSGPAGTDAFCLACPPFVTNAVYTRPIGLAAALPVNDVYGQLDLTFVQGFLGQGPAFGGLTSITFMADTDLPGTVPEPASMGLIGVGLIGISLWKKRRG